MRSPDPGRGRRAASSRSSRGRGGSILRRRCPERATRRETRSSGRGRRRAGRRPSRETRQRPRTPASTRTGRRDRSDVRGSGSAGPAHPPRSRPPRPLGACRRSTCSALAPIHHTSGGAVRRGIVRGARTAAHGRARPSPLLRPPRATTSRTHARAGRRTRPDRGRPRTVGSARDECRDGSGLSSWMRRLGPPRPSWGPLPPGADEILCFLPRSANC